METLEGSCCPFSADEDRRVQLERMSEPPVYLVSLLVLTLEERIAFEESEAEAGAKPELNERSRYNLWLCTFVNRFLNVTSFEQVQHQVDGWIDCIRTELKIVNRATPRVVVG